MSDILSCTFPLASVSHQFEGSSRKDSLSVPKAAASPSKNQRYAQGRAENQLTLQAKAVTSRLTYTHIHDMVSHMKTTLVIDDSVMARVREEAARRGTTISAMVEAALRLLLNTKRHRGSSSALPVFDLGGSMVDIADREALYHAMEGR